MAVVSLNSCSHELLGLELPMGRADMREQLDDGVPVFLRRPLCCMNPQVVVNYVAMTPQGRVFENSLEKQPFDIRVGAGQVLPGLDEGLLSMKVRCQQQTGV